MAKGQLKAEITRLDIFHEVKAMRYLQSIMMNYLLSLTDYVERIEKLVQREKKREEKEKTKEQEKVSHTLPKEKENKKEKEEKRKEKAIPENLKFQFFSLSKKYYEALTREYGANVVNDACVVLDSLMMRTGKAYADPKKKLREICEMFDIKDNLVETLSASAQLIRSVNYEMIETEEDALRYMRATPFYMRNIDKGFIYLSKKFPGAKEKLCI